MFDELTCDNEIKVLIAELIDLIESLNVSMDDVGKSRST
jgi:hypothetical protein